MLIFFILSDQSCPWCHCHKIHLPTYFSDMYHSKHHNFGQKLGDGNGTSSINIFSFSWRHSSKATQPVAWLRLWSISIGYTNLIRFLSMNRAVLTLLHFCFWHLFQFVTPFLKLQYGSKFGCSEKATNFEKNLPLKIWGYSVTSNFKWNIFSNFVAFSEYPNFM